MYLIKDIITDFCLFSLIEGFIFCLFFEKIGGCKKFKLYEIFILSFINCSVSVLLPPLLFQLVGIIYFSFYNYIRSDVKNILFYIKLSILVNCFLIVIEMFFTFLYDILFNLKAYNENLFILFLMVIPVKIFEIIIIYKWGRYMKWFMGSVKR